MISWPPMFPRLPLWRSPKWLEGARDESCVRCGTRNGTVVSAHYSGLYAEEFGKGRGIKVGDQMVADLCSRCHDHLDSYAGGNDDARALEFFRCILRTQMRRLAGGGW